MEARTKTVCFTGHRHLNWHEREKIDRCLFNTIENLYMEGYTHFIAGGALVFDTLVAKEVLNLKRRYNDVKLTIAIPCPNQSISWHENSKKDYEKILSQADNSIIVCDHYFKGCMHVRNRYMVDNSSTLVAFYRGSAGGTAYTYNYASKKSLYIINLADEE